MQKSLQEGRTLLEILAILVIIGIVSVLGLDFYAKSMVQIRTNDILHESEKIFAGRKLTNRSKTIDLPTEQQTKTKYGYGIEQPYSKECSGETKMFVNVGKTEEGQRPIDKAVCKNLFKFISGDSPVKGIYSDCKKLEPKDCTDELLIIALEFGIGGADDSSDDGKGKRGGGRKKDPTESVCKDSDIPPGKNEVCMSCESDGTWTSQNGTTFEECGKCVNGVLMVDHDKENACYACDSGTYWLLAREDDKTVLCGEKCCQTGMVCDAGECKEMTCHQQSDCDGKCGDDCTGTCACGEDGKCVCEETTTCTTESDCDGKCGDDCTGTCACGEDGKCVCEGTTECTTESDCEEITQCNLEEKICCPMEKPYYSTDLKKCVECLADYGSEETGACPTSDKPLCKPVPEENPTNQQCFSFSETCVDLIEEKIGGVSFYKLPDNCTETTCSGCFKSKQDNKEYYYTCTKEKGVYTCSLGDSIDEKTFCGNCTNGNLGIDDCSGYCVPDHCSSLDEKYVKDHKGDTLTDDHPAFDSGRKPSTYGKDILKYGWKKLHQVGRGCTVHRTDGASYYCTKGDRSGYDYMCAKAGTTPIAFYSKIWGYHAWGYPTSGNCPMITEDASAGARDITRGEYAQVSGHIWGCKINRKYRNVDGSNSTEEATLYCTESERRHKLTSTSSWYCQTEQTEDDKQSVCHEEGQKASCSAETFDGSYIGGKESFKDDVCVWREKCYPSAVCKADTDCAGKCGEDCAGTCSCGEDGKCVCEEVTPCTTNSDCGSGEYCKILDDGNTNACNKTGGECVPLTNGNSGPLWGRMFYYQNHELMNKWTASNWCTAHGYQLASAEALHCKDGTCPEDYPWEGLKGTFHSKGFWLSDGDDCSSYGAVTSAKTIGNYKNSNLGYAVCFIPCDGNYGSGTTQACTTTDRPRCSPGGYCKACLSDTPKWNGKECVACSENTKWDTGAKDCIPINACWDSKTTEVLLPIDLYNIYHGEGSPTGNDMFDDQVYAPDFVIGKEDGVVPGATYQITGKLHIYGRYVGWYRGTQYQVCLSGMTQPDRRGDRFCTVWRNPVNIVLNMDVRPDGSFFSGTSNLFADGYTNINGINMPGIRTASSDGTIVYSGIGFAGNANGEKYYLDVEEIHLRPICY